MAPDAKDYIVFERAREIVIAEMQSITYGSYLPVLLGPQTMDSYRLGLERRRR